MKKINKKILKTILIMLIFLVVGLMVSNIASASWVEDELTGISEQANNGAGRSGNTVRSVMGAAINIVSTVAAGVGIIMMVVLGVQYTSKGAEGKAEAKKDLTGYIIGAVLLFGASGLLKLIQMFIDANLNTI